MELWLNVPGAKLLVCERKFIKESAERIQREMGQDHKLLIVNIGVMWGASMHCLRVGAPNATLCGVDIDFETHEVQYISELNAQFVKADSTKLHNSNDMFRNMVVDLLFIDGSHVYEDVKADINGWVPKLPIGGMVIFHDYNPAVEDVVRDPSLTGVMKAVDEWIHSWASGLESKLGHVGKLVKEQYSDDKAENEKPAYMKIMAAPGSLAAFQRIL